MCLKGKSQGANVSPREMWFFPITAITVLKERNFLAADRRRQIETGEKSDSKSREKKGNKKKNRLKAEEVKRCRVNPGVSCRGRYRKLQKIEIQTKNIVKDFSQPNVHTVMRERDHDSTSISSQLLQLFSPVWIEWWCAFGGEPLLFQSSSPLSQST